MIYMLFLRPEGVWRSIAHPLCNITCPLPQDALARRLSGCRDQIHGDPAVIPPAWFEWNCQPTLSGGQNPQQRTPTYRIMTCTHVEERKGEEEMPKIVATKFLKDGKCLYFGFYFCIGLLLLIPRTGWQTLRLSKLIPDLQIFTHLCKMMLKYWTTKSKKVLNLSYVI